MIEFAHLWFFALLPLPLLARWLLPAYKESKDSLQVPYFQRLVSLTGAKPTEGASLIRRRFVQGFVLIITWVLLLTALAKPEWVGEPVELEKSARDLMFVVDLSGSMAAEDFVTEDGEKMNRLQAVKTVLADFIQSRESDRLGLIVFGDAAYLQAPFTESRSTVLNLLNETDVAMAGQSTAFGDAIGLAISVFQGSNTKHRVLIALTDGNDTGSKVPPLDAAQVAAANGVTIYPIAMGDPATIGEEALDVESLQGVAEATSGEYFEALSRQDLERAYAEIDKLEPALYESFSYRPRQSVFHYPLALLAGLFLFSFPLYWYLGYRERRGIAHV